MTLIEASAGTGKTRALTGIVARLVVQEGRRLDEVLVVTFTRAACAELRDRIRGALRSTRRALAAGTAEEGSQAAELLAAWKEEEGFDPETAARRLDSALQDVDRANVLTIHGFCQRVLADLAFDGGFPFEFEVSGDDDELVAGAARDFWRRRMYTASRTLAAYAEERGFQPGELAAWVRQWRAKPGLRIDGGAALDVPVEAREAAWRGLLAEVRAGWMEHGEAFREEVLTGSWLNRGKYRAPRSSSDLDEIEAWFADPDPLLPPAGRFGRYGAEALAAALKKGAELPANPLFSAFDRLEEAAGSLRSACDAWLRSARREILDEARESIRRRVREDRRLGYDDLLLELHGRLQGEGGGRLAHRIRREYPVALIDEFQDTDPVQADVFMRIYRAPGGELGGAPEAGADGTRAGSALGAARVKGRQGEEVRAAEDLDAPVDDAASPVESETGEAWDWRAAGERVNAVHDDLVAANGLAEEYPGGAPDEAGGGEGTAGAAADAGAAGSSALCVVGDPKQSIYRFRGADVFAYLRARETAASTRALDRNWRSTPALVEAVNAVFEGANPFVVPEIGHPPVTSGRDARNPLRVEGAAGEDGPLRLHLLPGRADGEPWTKREASPFAVNEAAEEIARLLVLAEDGKAVIDGATAGDGPRKLTGADVAVLVRTRAQGRLVADALRERGVASVEVGDASVFDSREAEQMERLLWALVEPGREGRERGALAGDLFGLDARRLHDLEEDEEAWAEWSERLRGWRSEWAKKGIGALLRRLVEAEGGAARLLRYRDGARRLTNVRHLTELLQEAEADLRAAPAALAGWFSRRRAEGRTRDDDTELRIESDESLVRILTVHGAKGLEFPVVFLPFAWDARDPSRSRDGHAAYHEGRAEGYREVLDLDPAEPARAAARREELSEDLRLLYVALTRAKHRCVVTWGRVNGTEHAPLAWLLHRGAGAPGDAASLPRLEAPGDGAREGAGEAVDREIAAAAARFREIGDAELHEEVRALARPRPHAVSVSALAANERARPTILAAPPSPPLAARRLGRPLPRTRQVTSFSALSAVAGPPGAYAAPPDVERPDHDQHEAAEPASGEPVGGEAPAAEARDGRTAFTFPRGATAGSCLHRIFERIDGADDGPPDLDRICREELSDFGFAAEWVDAARSMVERARAVRLAPPDGGAPSGAAPSGAAPDGAGMGAGAGRAGAGDGFRLADPVPRLVELDFAFPVAGLDPARLAAALREGGYPDPFPPSPVGPPDDGPLPPPIDGYLRGFIDLVVEHRGRWYVVDYKSNWLGASPEDYAVDAVAAYMRSSAYPLQYLLYLVALHRYLGLRLPGYDYDRHVGGAFYLFVRGMDPAAGTGRGVWFDRPEASFVHGLDRLFRGGEV